MYDVANVVRAAGSGRMSRPRILVMGAFLGLTVAVWLFIARREEKEELEEIRGLRERLQVATRRSWELEDKIGGLQEEALRADIADGEATEPG